MITVGESSGLRFGKFALELGCLLFDLAREPVQVGLSEYRSSLGEDQLPLDQAELNAACGQGLLPSQSLRVEDPNGGGRHLTEDTLEFTLPR